MNQSLAAFSFVVPVDRPKQQGPSVQVSVLLGSGTDHTGGIKSSLLGPARLAA